LGFLLVACSGERLLRLACRMRKSNRLTGYLLVVLVTKIDTGILLFFFGEPHGSGQPIQDGPEHLQAGRKTGLERCVGPLFAAD
jgi:hypothetical protein